MRALETPYNGIDYRSRLEWRWALYWDELGLHHDYEPEGFDLLGENYLPDFWLPEERTYYEVKHRWPEIPEAQRARRLAAKLSIAADAPVIILFGAPWELYPVRFAGGDQMPFRWPDGPQVERAIAASRSARFWK